jgi:predicted ferric reductase
LFGLFIGSDNLSYVTYSYLTWLNHLVIWGTLAAYFGIIAFLSYIVQDEFHSVMFVLFEDITFWLALAIITAGAMLPIVVIKSYVFNYRPQHFQEVQKLQRVPESPYYIGRRREVESYRYETKQVPLLNNILSLSDNDL